MDIRRFAIGDIHGSISALKQCLDIVKFDYENDILIQLGDIVDRHDYSYECVEELLKIKKLVSIRGNHDDWWYKYLLFGKHQGEWEHGGLATLGSYSRALFGSYWKYASEWRYNMLKKSIPKSHLDFFENQINYYILDRMLFVHGGFDKGKLISDQAEYTYYWDRELWKSACIFQMGYQELGKEFKYIDDSFDQVFIGHCPLTDGNPASAVNITNIDTYCGGSGRLTIMDIDTKKYWQSDFQ